MIRKFAQAVLLALIGVAVSGNYAANPVLRSVLTVSSVNCGGVPVGDNSNLGTDASPLATIPYAISALAPGGTIRLNGCPGSVGSYDGLAFNSSVNLVAINSGYALLGSSSITATTPTGSTIGLSGLILDPSGTGGSRALTIFSTSGLINLNLTNDTIQNWIDYGIFGSGFTRVTLVATNTVWNGGAVSAGMYLPNLKSGSSITIDDGSCNITALNVVNFGCQYWVAQDATVTAHVNGHAVSVTTDPSQMTGGFNYGFRLQDIPATIENSSAFCANGGVGSLRGCQNYLIAASLYGISGSQLKNDTFTNQANSGIGCALNGDAVPSSGGRSLLSNGLIDNCRNVGTNTAAVEGIVVGSSENTTVQNSPITGLNCYCGAKDSVGFSLLNNSMTDVGLVVDKGNRDSVLSGNTQTFTTTSGATAWALETNSDTSRSITGITQANPAVVTVATALQSTTATGDYFYLSGVGGMTGLNGSSYQITLIDSTHFSIGVDTTGFPAYTSGGTAIQPSTNASLNSNNTTNSGGTTTIMINQFAGSTFTPNGNTWTLSSGTVNSQAYRIAGPGGVVTDYATCAAYNAALGGPDFCVEF